MTLPTHSADGHLGRAEPIVPVELLALRERLLRPRDPKVAARHVAGAVAEVARVRAASPSGPRHLKATLEELTPGRAVVPRATFTGARVAAVVAATVLGTAGLAAAQVLPAPANRTISSVIEALDLPVPWSEPATPAPIPAPPEPQPTSPPASAPERDRPGPTSTEAPTTSTTAAPTTSTTTSSTTTTVPPTTTTTAPSTTTTTTPDDDDPVDGTEEPPTTTTTVPDDDGTASGTEQPPKTTTTVPGDDDAGSAGAPA